MKIAKLNSGQYEGSRQIYKARQKNNKQFDAPLVDVEIKIII
jgi:hypothetical protein